MGTSISKASPLAQTFERMETWDLKSSRRLLQDYKDKDLDFGLDAQGLAELLGGDKGWAESIIDAFRSSTGIINALAFICGACLVSSGPALEKAGMIFEALDFDGTEQISMDEMTIAFLCCARGFCVMSGIGTIPSDEELEAITLQAYRDLNKGSTQSITKSEFTKWIMEFASGTRAPPTREVSLQNALEQFRVVPLAANTENTTDNNAYNPAQESSEETDALDYNEVVPADELHADERLPQGEAGVHSENASEWTVEQEHERTGQPIDLPEPIEPEHVPADADEQFLSGDEVIFDAHEESAHEESAHEEAETSKSAPTDENYEAHLQTESGDQGSEAQEATPAGEPVVSDADEVGLEAQYYPDDAANTESNFPTVAEAGGPPHESEWLANEAHEHSASDQEHSIEIATTLVAEPADVDVLHDDEGNLETQPIEQSAGLEELVAESPLEPTTAGEPDDDDLVYEQDEFAEETPRLGIEAGTVDVYPVGENAEVVQSRENAEQSSPIEPAAEVPEPTSIEVQADVATGQEVAEQEVEQIGKEPVGSLIPKATQDQEPLDAVLTPEDVDAETGTLTEESAVAADTAKASAPADVNAYDTFNFESPRFDGSSGLPPPEPQKLLDDSVVAAAENGNHLEDE
ncbi:hypothetical protein PRIC1_004039 [Phytophthora ramorum]